VRRVVAFGCNIDRMTPRRALLALSLVAIAAPAAASPAQAAPPAPPATAQPATPAAASSSSEAPAPPVDPIAIAFEASVDHDAEDAAGPKLLKYVIDFVPAGGALGKSHTIDLGKPKPVGGSIAVPLTKVLLPGRYVAHVRAVGRGMQMSTVTVGPFVITERIGKTQEEYDKELRAPDKPQDKRTTKPKDPKDPKAPGEPKQPQTQPQPQPTAPPGTTEPKDGAKPAGKGGFWKKFYEKVVGDPQS
jgi:hypothetical protein